MKHYYAVSLAAVFLVANLMPLYAQAPATVLAPAQKQAEEASAKGLVERMIDMKAGAPPPADMLTNRSAALMGFVFFVSLAMISAFSSMGNAQEKAKAKPIDDETTALTKKYDLAGPGQPNDQAAAKTMVARLEGRGREFYMDVMAVLVEAAKDMPDKVKTNRENDDLFPPDITSYSFDAVSPTEVKIATKELRVSFGGALNSATPGDQDLSARLEDGEWRLDFGGIDEMGKMMGAKSSPATSTETAPPAVVTLPEHTFFSRQSSDDAGNGDNLLEFSDSYHWAVSDKVFGEKDESTDNGRKAEVWLGQKADYFHILHTDLVAIKPHNASYPRQDTLSDAIIGDDVERVKELVSANPSLANVQPGPNSPLGQAVFFDHPDIAETLIHLGARVNQTDPFGQTLLMEAALFDKADMVKLLLQAGVAVNQKDDQGETALRIAEKAGSHATAALLKQYGAR